MGILYRKRLAAAPDEEREQLKAQLVEEQIRISGGVSRAMAIDVVDEVIAPEQTRERVALALREAPGARGDHGNITL